ncbi:hypothetical protein EIP91_005681 [Steccherinum ochraceum]|uniref:SMAD/FHA domain-containing protein n=1 Tax=Steccherinum ochraceum TaxID=92696 RepID=A0A4R0R6T7_9APHY|nr:hypothetical protein EIP91_005681 [Steccherinum ochraceum]
MDPVAIGTESPPARQSILGSFLRSRPRGTSQSHPSPPPNLLATAHSSNDASLPPRNSPSPSGNGPSQDTAQQGHRRRPAAAISPNLTSSHSSSGPALTAANLTSGAFSHMLRRRRSAGALANSTTPQAPAVVAVARTTTGNYTNGATPAAALPATASNSLNPAANPNSSGQHRIRLVPHLDSRRSLKFDPICRDVREGDAPLRIGRFTDRSGLGLAAANALGSNKLAFKSKVVSRAHAEIWVEAGGRFFIKDTKSSSGTFLNHVRLSPANAESRPSELKDGDMLQLGVDYQGGTEDIYKCVKIKIEMGREWQAQANPFNANALKQLKAIAGPAGVPASGAPKKTIPSKSALPDCCICLFAVTINQALFIAPCSHAFHYKCLRPLLEQHHPAFSCPLCRTFANLEEDVEVEIENESIAEASAIIASVASLAADAAATSASHPANGSRERVVVDRGDRDAGAETEVEDGPRSTSFRNRSRMPPLPSTNPFRRDEVMEDVTGDHDMEVDMPPLPPLPEGVNVDEIDSGDDESRSRRGGGSRAASISPGPSGAHRSTEFLSEGDGDASGDIEGGGSSDVSGRASADGTMNGKRKR